MIVVRLTGSALGTRTTEASIIFTAASCRQPRIQDLVLDASLQPLNEPIVTRSGGYNGSRWQVAPGASDGGPKDAIGHAKGIYPPHAARLVGQHQFNGSLVLIVARPATATLNTAQNLYRIYRL